jgi:hypothetical protein
LIALAGSIGIDLELRNRLQGHARRLSILTHN